MNFYVVTEGVTEKRVYSKWIPDLRPNLTEVNYLEDLSNDKFLIRQGGGLPNYFEVIAAGVEDVYQTNGRSRLVVCVDSEEQSYTEKFQEINLVITGVGRRIDYRIVIQHFCFETWALGNRAIATRNPQSERLRLFRAHWDVEVRDPELLLPMPNDAWNRSQFAETYLRALLNEKFRNLTYTKGNPDAVARAGYLNRLKTRLDETKHIGSFAHFLSAFA